MVSSLNGNILIIGSNGQLGSDIVKEFSNQNVIPLTHKDIEITNKASVLKVFKQYQPTHVINTASYHNVPLCETQPEEAMKVNILGPRILAQSCAEIKAELLHFSTDYVFDGEKGSPYTEEDREHPLNFYAITKLAGEKAALQEYTKVKILRVSGIYGKVPCRAKGGNFVSTMLKLASEKNQLKIVDDEILTPTYTLDIAKQLIPLLKVQEYGVFHISNQGQCSWFDFAKEIFSLKNISIELTPIKASTFDSPVKRPAFSVLENKRLKDLGVYQMPHWKDALKSFLTQKD